MAHFAELDSNNTVLRVIKINNEDIKDPSTGNEVESFGVVVCQQICGEGGTWKQTSYNHNFRGNYAGLGHTYMSGVRTLGVASTDIFIEPQPYASWTIGIETARWYPPLPPGENPGLTTAQVNAGYYYEWNETKYNANPTTAWDLKQS